MAAASELPDDHRQASPQLSPASPIVMTAPVGALGPDGPADGALAPEAMGAAGVVSAPDATTVASPTKPPEVPKHVQEVLQSEIGTVTMLNRLKQSVGTAKEFAVFLKKRAQLEEDYSAGMRKLGRSTQDAMTRTDHGQGSGSTFGSAFGEMMDIHNRMADNGYQFAMSLHQMHEDLLELAAVAEKNRKGWKQTGLAAEQRVADLETVTRKSKAKYDALAEEYDRLRTGDLGSRRGFGFKGHKSAAQQEEELLRKVQTADEDYHGRVDTLARERAELLATGRPEIIKALQDLVRECDGGMVLQVQKYVSLIEKLLLSNGLNIIPMQSAQQRGVRSLRDIVTAIDMERDLNNHLDSFYSKVPPKMGEPKYERHPVLGGSSAPSAGTSAPPRTHNFSQSVSHPADTTTGAAGYGEAMQSPQGAPGGAGGPMYGSMGPGFRSSAGAGPVPGAGHERSFSYNSGSASQAPQLPSLQPQHQPPLQVRNSVPAGGDAAAPYSPASVGLPSSRFYAAPAAAGSGYGIASASQGPPQLGALPFQTDTQKETVLPQAPPSQPLQPSQPSQPSQPLQAGINMNGAGAMNPVLQQHAAGGVALSRPVFGVPLDVLYERDGAAVPMVVHQCIQAVDLFGLAVEGIYRLSGSLPHVNKLKAMFDTDSASPQLDFRNPENFFHDVNSVAGLLKQFFRDLPDPLLTRQHYDRFIEAAQHDDDTVRRDSLHAVINDLPDPNYATLRALILHLNRVVENAHVTRMTAQNLAIVFGPTLLGAGVGDPEKGRWHVRIIDTILQNTYQIFDED